LLSFNSALKCNLSEPIAMTPTQKITTRSPKFKKTHKVSSKGYYAVF